MRGTHIRTLSDLAPGESGVIVRLGGMSRPLRRRIADMGFTPGTRVAVRKTAPFGDPLEVQLRGYGLSLRRADAAGIWLGEYRVPGERTAARPVSYVPRRLSQDRRSESAEPSNVGFVSAGLRKKSIALVGSTNSGKATLFNALTGSSQHVDSWPGVAVETKEGETSIDGLRLTVMDLPGIYSLSPFTPQDRVALDFFLKGRPDALVNIADATNLERNLSLTLQLLELEVPMVLALSFMDGAKRVGDEIDMERLSEALGIPVVPFCAKTGKNLEALLRAAVRQTGIGSAAEPENLYDHFTQDTRRKIQDLIRGRASAAGLPVRWASIRLLEGDEALEKSLGLDPTEKRALENALGEYTSRSAQGDRDTRMAGCRYAFIKRVMGFCVKKGTRRARETASDRIDKLVTHRLLALPLFLAMMLCLFLLTFGTAGAWLSHGMASFLSQFTHNMTVWLSGLGTAKWLVGLLCSGILSGVGGVLTFLPQIALLSFFLSLLENSGYMSRAAFILDRLFRRFGLSGKAFTPLLMGLGCSVLAVQEAHTMEWEKDRRMTILLLPLMSCSAKLPVYGLITSAFFGPQAGLVVFGLYLLGMLTGVLSGLIFHNTLSRGEPVPFVLELPPYRIPSLSDTLPHVWNCVKVFLVRAGTFILLMSILLWFLQSFDSSLHMTSDASESLLGDFGSRIAPLLRPLGFGFWQAAVALLTGLAAKEAVVASLSMFYGFQLTASDAAVAAAMASFTPLSALSFLVFFLLYAPCIATVSVIYKEMNSIKWTLLSVLWQLLIAYGASLVVCQFGRLLGLR